MLFKCLNTKILRDARQEWMCISGYNFTWNHNNCGRKLYNLVKMHNYNVFAIKTITPKIWQSEE